MSYWPTSYWPAAYPYWPTYYWPVGFTPPVVVPAGAFRFYELYLRHYDRDGTIKTALIVPLWARYVDGITDDDPLVFALNVAHPAVDRLEEFDIVEVLIRNRGLGIEMTRAFVGIVRGWDYETDENGITTVVITAPSERHILAWRHVMWPEGTNLRSAFSLAPAETVMKNLVTYNCTASATAAAGRWRDGDLSAGMGFDVSVAADQTRGELLSGSFMGANVLASLAKLTEVGGGDFSLLWQGDNDWEFEFHLDQLGEDKSSGANRVLFSLANYTIRNARLQRRWARATVAIAGGPGKGAKRLTTEVWGPNFENDVDVEAFVNAGNEAAAAGRELKGALYLDKTRVEETLTFKPIQTSNQFYAPEDVAGRKTFRAGDLVLVNYRVEQVHKIERIHVDWSPPGREDALQIEVETRQIIVQEAGS